MHLNAWHVIFTTSEVSTRSLPGWLEGSMKPGNMKEINSLQKKKCYKLTQKLGTAHCSYSGLWISNIPSAMLTRQTETTQQWSYRNFLKVKVQSYIVHPRVWLKTTPEVWRLIEAHSCKPPYFHVSLLPSYWSWHLHLLYSSRKHRHVNQVAPHFSSGNQRPACYL